MPDRWTLRTPSGDVQLNASFSAPQYQPGGVDRGAAMRRDGRATYQRSGDGLPTPGPLRLNGRVWSDAQTIPAMLDELDDIRDAVNACTDVVRETSGGTYTYSQLAGGPPPAITPDGLGGFQVEIELWPGRPNPTFLPPGVTLVGGSLNAYESTDNIEVALPSGLEPGDTLVVFTLGDGNTNGHRLSPTPSEPWTQYAPATSSARGAFNVWRIVLEEGGVYSLVHLESTYASRKIVGIAALRAAESTAVQHYNSSDLDHVVPSQTLARPGALLTFFSARDASGDFTGVPFTTPTEMTLLGRAENTRLKGLLAFQRVGAGSTGDRESSQAPDTAAGFSAACVALEAAG